MGFRQHGWHTGLRQAAAGALVVQRPFDHYAAQRQAALDAIDAAWILLSARMSALRLRLRPKFAKPSARREKWWAIGRRAATLSSATRCAAGALRLTINCACCAGLARYAADRQVHEIVELAGLTQCAPEAATRPLQLPDVGTIHRKQRVLRRL